MKSKKIIALMGVTLLSASTLAACGSSSETDTSTYTYVYSSDPQTLDYLVSNRSTTGDVVGNLIDGLLENDEYGNLVPSLATDWTVSEDGLTYTYTLREDANWYTADGEEYAPVTAQDFVTGLKHAADAKSEALYLVQDSIAGLDDYVNGVTTDFDTVGVKAVDDYTVQYTLTQPESYWNSKLTMGILFPLNADFLESKGDDFGSVDVSSILYNGPYILSGLTAKSSMEYTKNEGYYDADSVSIENIKLSYYDGTDPESLANGFDDGNYTVANLYPTTTSYESIAEKYADNIVYNPQDATTYWAALNVNRQAYNYTSKTTDAQKTSTTTALRNQDFRQAILFGFDRVSYMSQSAGEDGASKALRSTIVPSSFVQIGDEDFGTVVEDKLTAYGSEWDGVELDDAQDSFYNTEKAQEKLAAAKATLEAEGVEFPIHLDLPVDQSSDIGVQAAQSLKQSIEASLGTDNVVVDLQLMDSDSYYNITYYAESTGQLDYDISTATGWGPDYDDPSTYLDIMSPVNGASIDKIGITAGSDTELVSELGLDEYQSLIEKAQAETSDLEARYTAYAQAQAWLTDSALLIPVNSRGASPSLRYTEPFTAAFSWSGIKGGGFKRLKIQDTIVTTEEYDKAYEEWKEKKSESNAEYQEELADHVESD